MSIARVGWRPASRDGGSTARFVVARASSAFFPALHGNALGGMILLEQTEDWHAGKRYMSEQSMQLLYAHEAGA